MPNRPQPGQNFGKFDLGALLAGLAGIFGGIEANPTYGQTETDAESGLTHPVKGSEDFYKPRSILNKSEAARANAQFKARNVEADQDVARRLQAERDTNPIMANRQQLVGDVANSQTSALDAQLGRQGIVQALGLPYNPNNSQFFDKSINPVRQAIANLGAQTGNIGAENARDIAVGTRQPVVDTGLANAAAEAQTSEYGAQHAKEAAINKMRIQNATISHILNQTQQGSIFQGHPGSRFFTLNPNDSSLRDIGGVPSPSAEEFAIADRYKKGINSPSAQPLQTNPQGQPITPGVGPMNNSQGIQLLPDGSLMLNGTIFKKSQAQTPLY